MSRLRVVFFFKQKTAYEMRISDWSSDVDATDRILDLADDVVRKVVGGVSAVLGIDRGDEQEAGRRLGDGHALALDSLREQGGRGLELVLDLDLGDVGIGAPLEGKDRKSTRLNSSH